MNRIIFHYTDRDGYNSISAAPIWRFVASRPPGDHPRGAYFTTLFPDEPLLTKRLRIPKEKVEYVFVFHGDEELRPLEGGRGKFILYSDRDYVVSEDRQVADGSTAKVRAQAHDWRN